MKTIVCFGDSNTWGFDPATKDRMDRDTRWTGVLRNTLGADYAVIEEGLNGRTTVWDDPIEGYKNGKTYLIPCLESHRAFDLITIMLGTNDLKKRFSLSAADVANGAGVLVSEVMRSNAGRDGRPPQVLLIAPPPIVTLTEYAEMFEGAGEKSRKFSQHYARVAAEQGCNFLDAGKVIVSSELDGIHFESGEHHKLGLAVAEKIRAILK